MPSSSTSLLGFVALTLVASTSAARPGSTTAFLEPATELAGNEFASTTESTTTPTIHTTARLPASLGGVSALKALSAPYGAAGLRFMPTGGVTLEKLPAYLALPAVIAVGGSWMVPADALKARAYDKITQRVAKAVDAVAGVRPQRAKA